MVQFDKDMTEMIFFDTEFYVPENQRTQKRGSLISNPFGQGQFLLGGVFCRYFPLKDDMNKIQYYHIWQWRDENEIQVLKKIFKFFQTSWLKLEGKDHKQADLMAIGTGISRFDIPILFIRSYLKKIAHPEELFYCYYNLKPIDLSDLGIPFFNYPPKIFYPKSTNSLLRRFRINREKDSSLNVWEMYDMKQYKAIEKRTQNEVKDIITIYQKIYKEVFQ